MGKSGRDLIRGIATGYEIQIDLVRAICLHEHKIDHIAHLCPAQAAGIGTLLGLKQDVIYQAVQQAVHVSFTTRQSRKGEISSWKAYAPAHAGKLAVEAVDRVMRGEGAPSPIYEGEDSVIAWMLDGPEAHYRCRCRRRASQARDPGQLHQGTQRGIPVAGADRPGVPHARADRRPRRQIEKIVIHTSHHTHYVIGTGANDPQKMDPKASRETLDHSIMYIFAVALQDGTLAPRGQLRAEARRPRRHRAAVAQDRNDARIRNGRAAIARPIRTSWRSAAAWRSSCATAPSSSTRWRSPTRIRSAPGRSGATTTSASSAR